MKKQPKFKIDNAKLTRLVAKAQQGNEKALEDVVNMISGYLYYYSLGMLGNDEKAKDAVQDILLKMLQKLDTLENPQAFLSWIKMMTANHCHNLISRQHKSVSLDESFAEYEDVDEQVCPAKAAETAEVCAVVRGAVSALPVLQRESVLMFYFQQLSVRQIAEALEISENTVKSRLHAARQSLKKKLDAAGAAVLASCAIPPMRLISYSLITEAEEQHPLAIPYTTPSGKVMVATGKTASASVVSVRIAAAACAVLITAGGAGAAMSGAFAQSRKPSPVVVSHNSHPRDAAQRADQKPEDSTVVFTTAPVTVAAPVTAAAQPTTVSARKTTQAQSVTPATSVPYSADVTEPAAVPAVTAPATTSPAETQPETSAPKPAQPVIYFNTTGWQDFTKIYCYIAEKNGDPVYNWQSKQTLCTHYQRSYYAYDCSAANLAAGKTYVLVFSADNGAQTSNVEFTTARFGETVELKPMDYTWGNQDSYLHTYEAGWK